ncbi:MAG: molybdopterin-dependent oxidoreductase [Gemmatimonadetes bacterium]|nr:molybdopterin-dependent oxidoreductase [Gemmatimonadota bacterium]
METHRTTCKVGACEPFCGIEVDVEDGRLISVRPDREHPITKGYVCIKGMRVPDYVNDPERLLHPLRRGAAGLEPVSWSEATRDIGARLRAIRDAHGPRAIATYWGNAADSIAITLANTFCHAFGSPNSFNVLSLEYTDRGAVAERVLGNENLILQPDAARSRFALLLGTNPVVTQGMTLLQRQPDVGGALRGISKRGGRVVVVDPRRTETVRIADEHVPIRPGTDLFLLVAMIRRILDSGRFDRELVRRQASGLDAWQEAVRDLEPERAAEVTGIERGRIEALADAFAEADGAFATTRVGVQTSHNTTLTEWSVMTLNAITGNIDRPGGVYFNPGAFDVPSLIERFSRRRNPATSRVGDYPQIFGGPPCPVFADDVLSDDPERIRALVVVAGNPVITFPHTARVEAALERLELLVCIDIYPSDTCAFADYALPAATLYEKGGLHFLTSNFEPRPYLEWKPKLIEPRGEARPEWQIFRELSRAAGVPFLNDPWVDRLSRWIDRLGIGFGEEFLYRFLLLGLGKPGLGRLKRSPGGIELGEIRFGQLLERGLRTPDGRLQLAPREFVEALGDALAAPPLPDDRFPFLLISGARRLASYNSWTHHIPALMDKLEGNWATLNPQDAARLGIEEGQTVRISSSSGALEIEARLSDDMRPGVVSVHQFWGHRYETGTTTSRRHPGVNVNLLHDDRVRDRFSGMPVYNGTPCRIEAITGA